MLEKRLLRLHRSAAVLLAVLAASPAEAATCHVDSFQLNFGQDIETRMTVTSGAVCGVSFVQGGRGRTVSAGGINHLAIAEQASHGRAGMSGLTSWGYASQKDYVGQDRFTVESGGEIMYDRVIRGTSRITVDVDVTR